MTKVSLSTFWLLLLFALLFVNEYNLQWIAAVAVGKYGLIEGFKEVYQFFSVEGYAFFTATRLPPYFMLVIMVLIARKKQTPAIGAIAWAGLIGVVGMIIVVEWSIVVTYYMDVHVPSTSAIGFLVAPILSVPSGLVCGLLGHILYFFVHRK